MTLTWMPPRKLRRDPDDLYAELRHWLVDEDGRILAAVIEPPPDKAEESFDARLYYTMTDDTAYFISLEHAKAWTEKRARKDAAEQEAKKRVRPATVAVEARS
jgi:hypothetical protein